MKINKWNFHFRYISIAGLAFCLSACSALNKTPVIEGNKLTQGIFIQKQPTQLEMSQFKTRGFSTVIDLRPDGESADQPSSTEMSNIAETNGLKFYYVPVKPGIISEQSIDLLADALKDSSKPVLMYCRSGSRAARTWSLVEASRKEGMDVDSILAAVKNAGQSADDLKQNIIERIANRKSTSIQSQ